MIRDANFDDLSQIAELHIESFDDHFLPKLGSKLLAEYYKAFMDNKNILIVSIDEKTTKINGLVLGTPNTAEGRNRFIRKNKLRLAMRILLLCLKLDKDTWVRVLRFIKSFFPGTKSGGPASPSTKPNNPDFKVISLLSICVSRQSRGRGISKALIDNFEERLTKLGYEGYVLTVNKGNERAVGFYNKIGMSVYRESDGEYAYVKRLTGLTHNETGDHKGE